jgi:hypothetical protein
MRGFMEKLTQLHQIPKIPKSPFFNDKFQWVTKYIDFFFGKLSYLVYSQICPILTLAASQHWQ